MRDITGAEDRVTAVVDGLAGLAPDIVLLTDVDWDHGHAALSALQERLTAAGLDLPHRFAPQPNTGLASGADLDGDGRIGTARDTQGYGRFTGQGGMAILSRHPVRHDEATVFSALLWRDLPGAHLTDDQGTPILSDDALAVQRLPHAGHWVVPVDVPGGPVLILAFAAGPPVFDGPEDRNGRRNHDELRLWQLYLDGALGPAPDVPVILAGHANLDPVDGEGRHGAIRALLDDPRLQDPAPQATGGARASTDQAGVNLTHRGNPALDTADFDDIDGPGNLRLSYILPDARIRVAGAGVLWPSDGDSASPGPLRHHAVWVDLILEGGP